MACFALSSSYITQLVRGGYEILEQTFGTSLRQSATQSATCSNGQLANLGRKASSAYDNSRVEIVTYTNLPLCSFKLGGLPVLRDNQHHKGERQDAVNLTTKFVY